MKSKKLFMETTVISAEKTADEITSLLVQSGARRLMTEYDENQQISGLRFEIEVQGKPWVCLLPARELPVFKIVNARRDSWNRNVAENLERDRGIARRVAWRQLLRWVQAQLAMIETGMVDAGEVFLAYVQGSDGQTMYQRIISDPGRMLDAAKDPVKAEFV